MSVNSVYIREIAQGDGQNTRFSFPWKFVAAADILVYVDDVLQVSSQYDIDFPITKDNGIVVFKTAPAVGAVVVIRRADNMQQARLFKNQENFNAHEVEKAFDKLTLLVQEGFEELRRGALRMQSQSNLDYTIESLTIDDGMLALDLATKTYRQTSFTQAQVQKVINEAIRSADLSVRNQKWNDNTLTITFGDGTTIKGVSSNNVAQLRAQHDDRNHWWLEWSLDGETWHGVSGATDVTVHNDLVERDAAGAHPIAAITGLVDSLKTLAVKTTDFQTGITDQNKGITQAEYEVLDDKINTAALSGTNIGTYWFGLTGNQSGFVVPNPTSADQNYYDFTTSNFYTAKADLSGWNLAGSNPPPTDVDVNIVISSKFWDITEQNNQQGGMAMWSHTNSKWGYAPRIISFDDANLTGTPTAPDLTDESPDNQIVNKKTLLGYSGGAMPVGAIFTTPRTGTIQGAVEANGGEYNIADYSGAGSIGALLAEGKITYVSKAVFQTQVANTGACDSFGWNGTTDATFLVPKLNPWHTGKSAPVSANVSTLTFGNGGTIELVVGNPNVAKTNLGGSHTEQTQYTPGGPKTISNMNVDLSETTNLRVMVQIATGATDEALETCTSVLSDISALKYDYVVDFQAPTAANNYTWYRKYKSGWIRQGGAEILTGVKEKQITFPVVMKDDNYTPTVSGAWSSVSGPQMEGVENRQPTGMRLTSSYAGVTLFWTVEGQAA